MFTRSVFPCLTAWAAVAAALLISPAAADTFGTGDNQFTMDFVTVGDAGNAADTHGDGYGAVDYAYRIGTYEVTIGQFTKAYNADGNISNGDEDYWNNAGGSYGTGAPATKVSWHEAAKFCNWLTTGHYNQGYYTIDVSGNAWIPSQSHKQYADANGLTYFIPTEDEWYKAAYYDPDKSEGIAGYWDFPTRHDNHSLVDGIGSESDTSFDAVFEDGYDQGHPNDVSNSGVASAYGTYGQGGNVYEWNEAENEFEPSYRVVRGGYWAEYCDAFAASYRTNGPASSGYSTLGFRVASVPEPGSITLLVSLVVSGLAWRRRKQ